MIECGMINAGSVLASVIFFDIHIINPNRTARRSYNASADIRIIDVQGEIKRPNTAPRLTSATTITKLCSQTLGKKNHASPTAIEAVSAIASGDQRMNTINVPQENRRAKRILRSNRSVEMGTRARIMLSTITRAKK